LRELSLHLLDIAENSISAGAGNIQISVSEDSKNDLLQISVEDDGRGMSPEMLKRITDPFTTTRTTRKVGLGIPLLKSAAEACNGFLEITSEPGRGTKLLVAFQRSHIDRMPLGDLISTVQHLIIANPQIHWIFEYWYDGRVEIFDDEQIKNELGDLPMTEPEVLKCIKEMLETMVLEINPQFTQDTITIQY
jgi:hypothetical protein